MAFSLFKWKKAEVKYTAAVLLFHRVGDPDRKRLSPYRDLFISPGDFNRVAAHLRKRFYPIGMPQFTDMVRNGRPVPQGAVLVTFDDGWADNYEAANPILNKYEIPAVIYFTTGYIDGSVYPYQLLLADWVAGQREIAFVVNGQNRVLKSTAMKEKEKTFHILRRHLKHQTLHDKRAILREMMGEEFVRKASSARALFMNWGQIEEISRSELVTIGAHSHTHTVFTALTYEEVRREIELCKAILEKKLGRKVEHFSYPNGEYQAFCPELLEKSGFQSVVTTHKDGMTAGKVNLLEIPRLTARPATILRSENLNELVANTLKG